MQHFEKHSSWPAVKDVAHKLLNSGFKAFLVGGAVRDGLLGKTPNDFDLISNAHFEDLEKLFPEALEVGKSFGIFILPRGPFQIEVASFRADGKYSDGRHPDSVRYGTPKEDAARRDFTINSLFLDFETQKVIDYFGGKKDLQARIIRTVGEARVRFNEDKLRILRALRFSTQLDFSLDFETKKQIVEQQSTLLVVAHERILKELDKLLLSPHRAKGFHLLAETGVLQQLLPKFTLAQPGFADHYIQLLYRLNKLGEEKRLDLIWSHVFSCLVSFSSAHGKNWHEALYEISFSMKELKFTRKRISRVEQILGRYPEFLQAIQEKEIGVALRMMGSESGLDLLDFCFLKSLSQGSTTQPLHKILDRYLTLAEESGLLPPPLVTGQDVIDLGVQKGPQLGHWLKKAYEVQLGDGLKSKDEVLNWLKLRI